MSAQAITFAQSNNNITKQEIQDIQNYIYKQCIREDRTP